MRPVFHNVIQNSEEWYELRKGKVTSSSLSKIMANYGRAFGEPAKKYAMNIAVEQITGNRIASIYSNKHMDRGHREEPLARMMYEAEMFCDVDNGGFFELDGFGASPDGLVDDDGLIEIKSAIASEHCKRIRSKSYDTTYKWQLIANMKFTGRNWIDFISYCSEFDEEHRLYLRRLYADDFKKEYAQIDSRLEQFLELIEQTKAEILTTEMIVTTRREIKPRYAETY